MIAKFVLWMSNFFHRWAVLSRPIWEFRIRFDIPLNAWLIEVKENDHNNWKALEERTEHTGGEAIHRKFPSYQTAHAEAVRLGLNHTYEQAFYTADKKSLHPAANAIENNVLNATGAVPMSRVAGSVRPIASGR